MANDYSSKAEKYTSFLDELAEKASVTSVLDGANSSLVGEFNGAGVVNLAKLTIDGLTARPASPAAPRASSSSPTSSASTEARASRSTTWTTTRPCRS
mgnify:CR=1 FL=1